MPRIGKPATQALQLAGYTGLGQLAGVPRATLAGVPRATLAALHGVGPEALRILDDALAAHGLRLG
nr:DNA-binding protein [Geodermatophilus normandii]